MVSHNWMNAIFDKKYKAINKKTDNGRLVQDIT